MESELPDWHALQFAQPVLMRSKREGGGGEVRMDGCVRLLMMM